MRYPDLILGSGVGQRRPLLLNVDAEVAPRPVRQRVGHVVPGITTLVAGPRPALPLAAMAGGARPCYPARPARSTPAASASSPTPTAERPATSSRRHSGAWRASSTAVRWPPTPARPTGRASCCPFPRPYLASAPASPSSSSGATTR